MDELRNLLQQLKEEETEPLKELLGCKKNDVEQILKAYSKLPLMIGGLFQTKPGYRQVLERIANKNDIEINGLNRNMHTELKISEIEIELFSKLFKKEYDQMTVAERAEFIGELEAKGLSKDQIASITSLGAITAAQLSGMGVYLLASSTVGAITSLLGITLPFAFYTTMSSTIAFVIGPVGFAVLGVMMYRQFRHVKSLDEALEILKATGKEMKNFFTGNIERATLAFKYIASVRIIKLQQYKDEIAVIIEETKVFESDLKKIVDKEAFLKEKIDELLKEMQKLRNLLDESKLSKEQVEESISSLRLKMNANYERINSVEKKRALIN